MEMNMNVIDSVVQDELSNAVVPARAPSTQSDLSHGFWNYGRSKEEIEELREAGLLEPMSNPLASR